MKINEFKKHKVYILSEDDIKTAIAEKYDADPKTVVLSFNLEDEDGNGHYTAYINKRIIDEKQERETE